MEQVIFRFVKVKPKHTRIEVDDDAESIPPEMVIRALRDYAD